MRCGWSCNGIALLTISITRKICQLNTEQNLIMKYFHSSTEIKNGTISIILSCEKSGANLSAGKNLWKSIKFRFQLLRSHAALQFPLLLFDITELL